MLGRMAAPGSISAVDYDLESCTHLPHPVSAQRAESYNELRDRDAFNGVEVDGTTPRDRIVARSSTTSLASPRIVVVHGATSVRRRRGMAASRESTTTGRRPISAGSHHQPSPRPRIALMW